ncbi:unnamed protein product [Nesidiocoris tenuis]|uniref:Uncharacterized protein n=1 Tax=Nesidiocoris tenuis TaxID=355587 RepID=A0A6H5GG14_9HEMI|nr:unnamed protein product [Nesidiocoris tenuis]
MIKRHAYYGKPEVFTHIFSNRLPSNTTYLTSSISNRFGSKCYVIYAPLVETGESLRVPRLGRHRSVRSDQSWAVPGQLRVVYSRTDLIAQTQ